MSVESRYDEDLLTVDELAASAGMTVRTTRYYAGLGLLPPPVRRGRMAYYSATHQARLDLIRALQDHGFTLSAIEKYLARIPLDASVHDLALQRAMLTSWVAGGHEVVTRHQLDGKAGRKLTDAQVERLVAVQAIRPVGDRYELLPAFDVGLSGLDLDIPVDSLVEANAAIQRHMEALADELTVILKEKVLRPSREQLHTDEDKVRLEKTMSRLRQLTLQAVVSGFQRAANQVISRSLGAGS
jgi:DNA-binding transcriptional MerR regulator